MIVIKYCHMRKKFRKYYIKFFKCWMLCKQLDYIFIFFANKTLKKTELLRRFKCYFTCYLVLSSYLKINVFQHLFIYPFSRKCTQNATTNNLNQLKKQINEEEQEHKKNWDWQRKVIIKHLSYVYIRIYFMFNIIHLQYIYLHYIPTFMWRN